MAHRIFINVNIGVDCTEIDGYLIVVNGILNVVTKRRRHSTLYTHMYCQRKKKERKTSSAWSPLGNITEDFVYTRHIHDSELYTWLLYLLQHLWGHQEGIFLDLTVNLSC